MNKLSLALAIAAVAFPAYAQTSSQSDAKKGAQAIDNNTREFVEKAAIGDMYEIQSSKLALDKSKSQDYRDLAQTIVDDHTKSTEQLKSIVSDLKGLQLPQQMDSKHQQMIEQLRSASANQFHQMYRQQQMQAHKTAIQLFENYADEGSNKELQQFASSTLPTLKEHLQMVQDLPEQAQGQAVSQAPQSQQGSQQQQARQNRSTQMQQDQQAQTQMPTPQGQQRAQANVIASPGLDHILGSDLRGTTVYGSKNENIGEISDIVLDREGNLVAVVVGVGGFLGIGAKNVAIPFDALEIARGQEQAGTFSPRRDGQEPGRPGGQAQQGQQPQQGQQDQQGAQSTKSESGTIQPQRIVLRGMTREDLENAPEFQGDNNSEGGRDGANRTGNGSKAGGGRDK